MARLQVMGVTAIAFTFWAAGPTLTANEKREKLLDGQDENYKRTSTDIRQAAGAPFHPAQGFKPRPITQTTAWTQTDKAWLVMLYKQKIITRQRPRDAPQVISNRPFRRTPSSSDTKKRNLFYVIFAHLAIGKCMNRI